MNFSNSRRKNIKMKRSNIFSKIIILLALTSVVLTFQRCEVEFFDEETTVSGQTGSIIGIVRDKQANALADVEVKAGDKSVYSNLDGTFVLSGIPTGAKKVISFSLDGYAPNQKVADVVANDTFYVQAALDKWACSIEVPSAQENTVSFQNASVKLPANSLVDEDGNTVNGNVKVNATWFDPTDSTYAEVFPGDFVGEDLNGNEVLIESFGFITVEIKQGDKELDLASGQTSEITLPVPSSILGNAPSTIPLWYFDEERGTWVEEGSAILQNGKYVGDVGHFSYWNADKEMETSIIKGRVVCDDGITPVPDAHVKVIGLDYNSSSTVLTDQAGWYELPVKSEARVKVRASRYVDWDVVAYSQSEIVNTATAQGMINVPDLLLDCSDAYSFIYGIYAWDLVAAWAVGENGTILERFYTSSGSNIVWVAQKSGIDQALYAIDCPSYDNFWVVGSKGTVLHSTDRSASWQKVGIGTVADLFDVEFHKGYYGWIVGAGGAIYNTVDRGQTWNPQNSETVDTLTSCSFISPLEGWVCGTVSGTNGIILHTTDGGNKWNYQNSHIPEDLNSICFIDKDNGWAVGDNGRITRTQDGGQTWTPQQSGTLEDLNEIDMYKIQNGNGCIVGNNGVKLITRDGGQSWEPDIFINFPNNIDIEAVDVDNDGWFWIGGADQLENDLTKIPEPTNGWRRQSSGVNDTLWAVKAVSSNEAWVVGNNGVLLYTDNAGSSWNDKKFMNNHLYVVEQKGSNIWIGGNDCFWISYNNGNSWIDANFIPAGESIVQLQFTDSFNGWAFLSNSAPYQDLTKRTKTVYQTTNGGLDWTKVSNLPPGPSSTYRDFHFIDAQTGWITDLNDEFDQRFPTLFSTVDGGASWSFEVFPNSEGTYYTEIFSLDGSKIWFYDGYFQKSEKENGKQWNSTNNPLVGIRYLSFVNDSQAFAIAEPDLLYYSQNGGQTWLKSGDQNNNSIESVTFYDMFNSQYGWLVDTKGNIYYTESGGK
jgi:photosystem II stability/assembly factor-like uncharacterized protein